MRALDRSGSDDTRTADAAASRSTDGSSSPRSAPTDFPAIHSARRRMAANLRSHPIQLKDESVLADEADCAGLDQMLVAVSS